MTQTLPKQQNSRIFILLFMSMLSAFGPFVTDFYHEDYVMWLSLLQAGCKAVGVWDILVDYRVARGSRSFNKLKSAKNRWRVYRDYLKLPLIPSVKAMVGYAINGLKKYR